MTIDELHLTEDQIKAFERFRKRNPNALEEDELKELLECYLKADAWQVRVRWGNTRGIDI